MIVDGVTNVNAHEHCVVLVGVWDQEIFFVLHFDNPRGEVLEFTGNLLYDVIYD